MSNLTPPPAGWYPDPSGAPAERWWNGRAWTASMQSPGGAATPVAITPVAPYAPAGPAWGAVQPYAPHAPLVPVVVPTATGYGTPPIGAWRSPVDNRPFVRGMGDGLKSIFAKYATFDGRASRSEYWYFALFNVLAAVGVLILALIGALLPPVLIVAGIGYFALIAWGLVVFIPSLALDIRRLRDGGFHWAFIFLSLLPFGSLALLVMFCLPSKHP
ncbi:MAG: DUF805 domain-containing protein [Actinobacteria bacterium]|nr:DUF805 domain-containing protein [Actinomycetota bacterium]